METSTANTLVSDHIIKALCNTLMHSLWQGILLAILTGAIIIFTKKASAAYRYNLLVGALILFAGGVLLTFMWQLQQPQPMHTSITYQVNPIATTPITIQPTQPVTLQSAKENITETVVNYFNSHYNIIVLIWFLIICAKSVQMGVGLHNVFYLKRTKVFAIDEYWENKLTQLAKQLRIKQAIGLMESGIAKVPMVVGHLKPVILIPIGLINSLTPDAVEAILVHELAHIRRRDYLVNLLQSLMEIVFFFNPAVLWISKLIKVERENCCDDIVLAQTSSKISYIQALVSCQEHQLTAPGYSMALAGNKSTLISRVKRIISNRNQSLNIMEKTLITICLVCTGLFTVAFSWNEPIKNDRPVKSIVKFHTAKSDTIIDAKVLYVFKEKEATYQFDMAHGTISSLQVDGKRIPDDQVYKYQARIDELLKGYKATDQPADTTPATAMFDQNQQPVLSTIDTGKQADMSPLKTLTDKIDSMRRGYGAPELKRSHDVGQELYREHLITDTNHLSITTHLDKRELIVNGVRMSDDVFQRIYTKFYKKGENGRSYGINYENGSNYGINYTDRYDPSGAPVPPQIIIPDFGDTLVKYGVIKDKRHIHAVFNDHELVINGVKQPDDVFQMLLKKYVTKPGGNVNITYTNNGLPDKRMEQNAYWAGQQRKIIDQMQREGLINNRADLSFTLTDKTFVINGLVQNGEVFQRYRQEYVPANAGDNWDWNYPSTPGNYSANAKRYRNREAYNRQNGEERQRVQDKKLVADLLQDGLITDPNNVTFTLGDKGLKINGKRQSDELYKKYKEKYQPDNTGTGWNWTYSHHE